MKMANGPMPTWLKQAILGAALLLALPGLPALVGTCCVALMLAADGSREAPSVGVASLTFAAVTLGAGGAVGWHALRSLRGKPSRLLRLPPAWALAGLFGFFVAVGLLVSSANLAPGFFFPPILLVAASLPPLLAVSWFTPMQSRGFTRMEADGLTWRRGVVAFAGGATVSVAIALVLETLLPVIFMALISNLYGAVTKSVQVLFDALAGQEIASAITSRGFIYVFVQIAVVAPMAEELAKPLVTLPLVGRLSRRDAFLAAAMAGAGFAALENVIYAGLGFYFWAGILIVRAVGGAIHPLGAGLVGLGWRDVLRGEPRAWPRWLVRFGAAAGMHALWNGGSLLVITLAGARFFGELPPEIDVLGLSAAGTTLALLIVLGLAALWMGRAIAQRSMAAAPELAPTDIEFTLSDRAAAIWALACLAAIVPAGIAGLQLLMR